MRSGFSPRPYTATALLVSAAILLTGCGGPPDASATTSPPEGLPAGIEVELFQLRSDVAERGAQVRVINGSDTDLVVTRLTFADDWFAGEAVRDRTSTIPAGRTIDLRFALPESACEDEPDAASRTSSVTFELESGGTATVDVPDPLGFTTLMHEKECLRHDLAQVATLEWNSFAASAPPLPAELRLSIVPSGGGSAAELIDVQTTNLLQFADEPAPFPLALQISGADAASEVPVPIIPLRCDAHAVMEDKRGTVFDIAVGVDGAAGVIEVAASEAMRGEILRWVADWCGFGPG
ncbi:MAG: hypothetical protein ABWY26_04585 [Microbacterium sp.]